MDTFGFESQYFDKGFGKVLNGLEQRVVSGLQQAASVVDEYPSQPQYQQGVLVPVHTTLSLACTIFENGNGDDYGCPCRLC